MRARSLTKIQSTDEVLNRVQDELMEKLNPVLRELAEPLTWISVGEAGGPSFLNGWTNYLSGFYRVSFMKDAQGFVHLRGLLLNVSGQAASIAAFVLPVGFRPAAVVTFSNVSDVGYSRINVQPDGQVFPSLNIVVAANGFRSLDGITFFAEQ